MNQPLISVIVPVYNVEKYLNACVESLVAQTYKTIEIVLVDDGSTDSSGEICDSLAETDDRIVVVHKENGGVSEARNIGIKTMHGEYLTFVDSDDYVSPDFIEVLYNAIYECSADISTCGHYRVDFDGSLSKPLFASDKRVIMSGRASVKNMFYGKICSASSGSKLYKKELFTDEVFPPLIMGEDTFIVYTMFSKANSVVHTGKAMYYYVQQESSVTNSKCNYLKFYDYVKLYDCIMEKEGEISDEDYFNALINRLIENNFWVYMKLRKCPGKFAEEKSHILDNIKKYRKYVLCNNNAQLRVRVACLLSYFGSGCLNTVYDNIAKKQ